MKNTSSVLAIMAHPGDAAVLCFGTLARYRKAGASVAWCCVTDGAGGNKLAPKDPAKLAVERQGHERTAAKLIGAELHFLGVQDGMAYRIGGEDDYILRLVDVVRIAKPDIIITHNPGDYHIDNQSVSKAAFIAANLACIFNIKTEHAPTDLRPALVYTDSWISRTFIPTDFVDISETFALKQKAVAANKIGVAWLRDFDKMSIFDLVEDNAKARGQASGFKYAEGFIVDPTWPNPVQRILP